MTRTLFALLISLFLSAASHGQVLSMDEQKLDDFAHAVASAEGFGVRHTIPTRFHNPGDIRSRAGHHYAGQVGLDKHGYVIFKSDAQGFEALKAQLQLMASGQSQHYGSDITISRMAKVYSGGSRAWAKIVSKQLGVLASTTLREYLDVAPDVRSTDDRLICSILSFEPAMPTKSQY
jgi:hypothetical protein